jgi:alpha,alpha-trehalase
VTVHGSRTPAFAANGKWRFLFAGIALFVTVSSLDPQRNLGQQSKALSPPPRAGNIDTYIHQGWDSLSRSMAECKTLVDPKVTTPPVLYLPFGAPAPPELLGLRGQCKIQIDHLPHRISQLGDVKESEIPQPGLLYLPNR